MGTKKKADKVTPDRRNQAEYAYIEKTLYARKRGKKERTTTEKKKKEMTNITYKRMLCI